MDFSSRHAGDAAARIRSRSGAGPHRAAVLRSRHAEAGHPVCAGSMTDQTRTFLRRFASTVLLWTLALWTIFTGWEPGFVLLIGGLGLVGLWEYYSMLDAEGLPNFKGFGIVCGAAMLGGSFYWLAWQHKTPDGLYDFEIGMLLLFLLVVFGRQMFLRVEELVPLETMALTLFGLLYVVWPFSFVTKIVYLTPRVDGQMTGHFYVLFLVLVTKFSDMGAYVVGSLFGRHPMVPHISPKKTWEGFVGALVFSVGGGCGLVALMPGRLAKLGYADAVLLGVVLGLAAIVGDLAESLIKRSCKVKDSGRFLPGIGGALDLIDSILFTAPVMFFYLRFALR
jgi:phosphatidate cytidylyltransferase